MKIIRDKLGEKISKRDIDLIYKDGQAFKVCISRHFHETLLRIKLIEEAKEVKSAHSKSELISELADCWEVIKHIAEFNDIELDEIFAHAEIKEQKLGGFREAWLYSRPELEDE